MLLNDVAMGQHLVQLNIYIFSKKCHSFNALSSPHKLYMRFYLNALRRRTYCCTAATPCRVGVPRFGGTGIEGDGVFPMRSEKKKKKKKKKQNKKKKTHTVRPSDPIDVPSLRRLQVIGPCSAAPNVNLVFLTHGDHELRSPGTLFAQYV